MTTEGSRSSVGRRSGRAPLVELGVFLLLAVVALIAWRGHLVAIEASVDEISYLRAADLVAQRIDPYEERSYLYPPPLAVLGAEVVEQWGEHRFLVSLRGANLVGGCAAVWLALLMTPWSLRTRAVVALGFVLLAPPFATGIRRGNLSLLTSGLAVGSLSVWAAGGGFAAALAAGALLGLSLAVKPMALLVIWVLLLWSYGPPRRWPTAALATCAGLTAGAALLIGIQYLPGMLANLGGNPEAVRITSLHRWLWGLGLELPGWMITVSVGVGVVILRPWKWQRRKTVVAVALTASLMALPVVWPHTMMLVLPVLALAGSTLQRRRSRRQASPAETVLVVALICAVLLSDGFGVVENPAWVSTALVSLPTLAPLLLGLYVLREEKGREEKKREEKTRDKE